jgi:hypothetical protein
MTRERRVCSVRIALSLVFERRYFAVALPKFHVMAVDKLLGLLLGSVIVRAVQWN